MKVTRNRPLFYRQRRSNLYRIFALVLVIVSGAWFAVQLHTGAVHNPFNPTLTPTRSGLSLTSEGEAFFSAGDLNSAIQAYTDATKVNSKNAGTLAELARIQTYSSRLLTTDTQRLQRLTEALNSIQQAAALAPDDSNVHAIYAFVLDWAADPALDPLRQSTAKKAADLLLEADLEANHAISLDSANPLALAFYAEILTDEQRWTQAEQEIQLALQTNANLMDVHRVYAYVLESTGAYNQAIQEYQNALAINPNLTFLYISIGKNYRQLAFISNIPNEQTQLYNLALQNFSKAVTINQAHGNNDPIPYTEIAKTYSQTGDFFSAELNAEKAISFDPTNADLYGRLGIIYQKARNYESAIYALQCAVSGCTPAISCQALFASTCLPNEGWTVVGLQLTPNTEFYYATYGSVLAALAPNTPSYCTNAVAVLTSVQNAYGNDPIVGPIVKDGLAICNGVATQQVQTPTPAYTPTLVPTPKYTPVLINPTVAPYPTWTP